MRGTLATVLLPAACSLCSHPLPWRGTRAGVCPACWAAVEHYSGTGCAHCGDPEADNGTICLACRDEAPPWRAATSVGPYRGTLRELILLLKSRGGDDLDAPLAELLALRWQAVGWPRPALITSVPSGFFRWLRRGYNHAELLARQLAHALGVPACQLLRRRRGAAQAGRSRSARLRLSARDFVRRHEVTGHVLLVDDVLTTGATAVACVIALRRAGAEAVDVLTLARAERSGRMA